MADRPILFSGPLVRAILDGRKAETRRLVTKATSLSLGRERLWGPNADWLGATPWGIGLYVDCGAIGFDDRPKPEILNPRIQPGDTLWVRESWRYQWVDADGMSCRLRYRADDAELALVVPRPHAIDARIRGLQLGERWRPSIFLPRWASRISLRVTSVRAERVKDITHTSALREGVEPDRPGYSARVPFARLWDQINGKRPGASWADNPWVWVIEFEVDEAKR